MGHHRFIIPLLILITVATFWRAFSCQFVNYDDNAYVFDNPQVLQGINPQRVAWAFTTDHAGNYHPLTWLSLMLDSSLQGSKPRGYHVTNVLLHTLAVVLLYLALQALTGAPWRSGLVALFFAIHPLRVESVAWISERKDVLSGCLAFATLLAYAAYAHRPHWGRYLIVTILFVLGLLAKPILVTLPCLLLLLDLWPLRRLAGLTLPPPSPHAPFCPPRQAGWLVLEKIPLLTISVASSILTYKFQDRAEAVASLKQLPFYPRLANIPVAYVRYLWKMVWFHDLAIYFPRHWSLGQIFGATALLLVITAAACFRFRRNPWLAIGWFWFLGMLVPVLGFVQVGHQPMADRYTYLPAIGLTIMLVWSLPQWLSQTRPRLLATGGATLAIVALLCAFTWRQIGFWQDTVTLFEHIVAVSPNDVITLLDLGVALNELDRPREELPYLRQAVAIAPQSALIQFTLAAAEMRMDQLDDALLHLGRAVQIDPDFVGAYVCVGEIYQRRRQFDLACSAYQKAIAIDPASTVAHANLGDILLARRQYDQALVQYQQALRLEPNNVDLNFQAAKALANLGRHQEALPYLQTVLRRQPDSPIVHAAIGQTFILLHRFDEAIANMQKASQLDPGNPGYRAMLAKAQAGRDQFNQHPQTSTSQP